MEFGEMPTFPHGIVTFALIDMKTIGIPDFLKFGLTVILIALAGGTMWLDFVFRLGGNK